MLLSQQPQIQLIVLILPQMGIITAHIKRLYHRHCYLSAYKVVLPTLPYPRTDFNKPPTPPITPPIIFPAPDPIIGITFPIFSPACAPAEMPSDTF